MNILLIGNGFDLEHGLPTSYADFLLFCKKVKKIYSEPLNSTAQDFICAILDEEKTNDTIKQMLIEAFKSRYSPDDQLEDTQSDFLIKTSNEELNELNSYIQHNIWLEYFWNLNSDLGNNWIDFESEISRVIKILDDARRKIGSEKPFDDLAVDKQDFLISFWKIANICSYCPFDSISNMDRFISLLNSELEKLIRSLEIYLAGVVSKIPITEQTADIENIHPDCVLSFNYTNTYERVYGSNKSVEYDYIHGKADLSKNVSSCNLVLGIDEYLKGSRKASDLEFLPFKKYYQRIYKSTGNLYLDWVDKITDGYAEYLRKVNVAYSGKPDPIHSNPWQNRYYPDVSSIPCPQHTLYIFGHSLDSTDKDVLKLLICNENVQTKIFYHRKHIDDKTTLGKQIKNLVKIMGPDELIRRTGGTHKTIEFIPQSLHED